MEKVLASVIEAIGSTPLVRLERITRGLQGTILAKLEYLNPGFSKKDRAARTIIEEAEQSGELRPRQPVVELTSGNMGTGLAIVCGVKGYPFFAVMSKGNSPERAQMMRALGAQVVLVDQLPGSVPGRVTGADLDQVEHKAVELTRELKAFRADQFHRDGNWRSHCNGTAREIWQQADGDIDAFVDFVGSGGTYAGVSKAFKRLKPGLRCYIVEPDGAAAIAGEEVTAPGHPIQGGGYAKQALHFLEEAEIDGFLKVTGEDAKRVARRLAAVEGIFGGFSGGANVAAALGLLEGEMRGKTVVALICDAGLKYLSTDLWT